MDPAEILLAQGMADVASIALVQSRAAAADQQAINEQLQLALTSRVVLRAGQGLLSQAADLDMATVFAVLRQYARDHKLRMSELAHAVVHRSVPTQTVVEHRQNRERQSRCTPFRRAAAGQDRTGPLMAA